MNPTIIIHKPRTRPWWAGTALARDRPLFRGMCSWPVNRVERIGLDRDKIIQVICQELPDPREL